MNLLFFLLQIGEWVGMTPLARAENRGLDPAMVLTTPQCVFSMEKDTVSFNWAQGRGLQERADLKTAPLLFFIPSPPLGHRPSCGPSSLPLQTSGTLSLLPLCWVTHMVPGSDAQVVTQRHTLLPKDRAAAGNPNPQVPAWSPSPAWSTKGDEDGDPTETCE